MRSTATGFRELKRQEFLVSGLRPSTMKRFRKPLLYPLSYEGARPQRTCQQVSTGAWECRAMVTAPTGPVRRAAEHTTSTRPRITSTDAIQCRRVAATTKE
jgi:hypothetical protein